MPTRMTCVLFAGSTLSTRLATRLVMILLTPCRVTATLLPCCLRTRMRRPDATTLPLRIPIFTLPCPISQRIDLRTEVKSIRCCILAIRLARQGTWSPIHECTRESTPVPAFHWALGTVTITTALAVATQPSLHPIFILATTPRLSLNLFPTRFDPSRADRSVPATLSTAIARRFRRLFRLCLCIP